MSELEKLIATYTESPLVKDLEAALRDNTPARHYLKSVAGDLPSFIMTALARSGGNFHFVICNTKEDAAYLYNTLQNIYSPFKVFFLPDSFKRPGFFEELDNNNVQSRVEIVTALAKKPPLGKILVTYPEAVSEKVIKATIIEENVLDITKGEILDMDTIISILVEYDFQRVDYVYEPGQFSIRGDIVDIFNYAHDWPVRIEFFDDEVESIRFFDPVSQLSKKEIQTFSLIPNVTSKFDDKDKTSVFDILPRSTVVWLEDESFFKDKIMDIFDKIKSFSESVQNTREELIKMFKERSFVYPREVLQGISLFHNVFLRYPGTPDPDVHVLEFASKPQPSFNKSFKLLIENLSGYARERYKIYIFAGNTKQIERFYQIFEDLEANIPFIPVPKSIRSGFVDDLHKVVCYTDHQIFQRFHRYSLRKGFSRDKALNIKMLKQLQIGDYVTHIDHGVGRYMGLETLDINGHKQESMRLVYKNNDILYVSINAMHKVSKYIGKDGTVPRVDRLGSDRWKKLKSRTKRKIKDIARELILLYAKRKASKGFQFKEDDYMQLELEASFIYEDTPDQQKAAMEVKADMQKPVPMDRLVCGDVGFGKTEIAVRAAFKAVLSGKQVAILVPTTILALQHYHTFTGRLDEFGVEVDYINRFKTAKEKKDIYKRLEEGKIDIIIGTHALLNDKVRFKDLGLLVLDEEQKFGVSAKEKLRQLKTNVDTLTLTATPIPRTLQFSLMGSRDMSIINTPPPNRQPIHTERRIFSEDLIIEAIKYELDRGGQVFFIHNRIKDLQEITNLLKRWVPEARIIMAHGKMESKELERRLLDFVEGKYDVLVSTNIIETGLDIPNANTMFINNAHHFGLSDLHQLRGRVGRSNIKAFCYLLAPASAVLTPEARKRLRTLEEFTDLGSGFNIAMRDLDIRGAGNLLGAEQSGFIADIGYETYMKILDEAIQELKDEEFKDVYKKENESKDRIFVKDVELDVDTDMLIPDYYVPDIQERLNLYTALAKVEDEQGIEEFKSALKDRFGKIPPEIYNLFEGLRIKWVCKRLGFERVSLKARKLRLYFNSNPQSPYYDSDMFKKIFAKINSNKKSGFFVKQSLKHLILVKENVPSLSKAREILEKLLKD